MPEKVDKEPIENMVIIQDLESHLNKHIPLHELNELANNGVYFNMGCEKQDKVRKTRIGKLRTWTRIPEFNLPSVKRSDTTLPPYLELVVIEPLIFFYLFHELLHVFEGCVRGGGCLGSPHPLQRTPQPTPPRSSCYIERERNGNYSHWFQQRMKRDTKRVVYLMNRMEQVDFVGEVVSGVNEGVACDKLNGKQDCDHEGSCSYRAPYANGAEFKGTLVFETVVFGDIRILNMAIGCGYTNKGTFGHQARIMGLGVGPLSLVYEIPVGGFFSYFFPIRDSQHKEPKFYYVWMIGLGVRGIRLPISEDIFHLTESGDGGVIMDSGTTVSRFPKVAYEAFCDAFIAQTMDIPRAPGVDLFDTCFSLPNTTAMSLVSFHFWSDIGEVSLVIPPRNFLVAVDNMGTACFAFAPSPASFSIIGNI
ncbi:hypothetical protein SO802_019902 [Lithocarpus litseifolius]|uniref:Peptidase A1 domain-containing protein n=1 Tax=Lithocarpus litseifolius TaxID=425828 RepID=A0AAW2CQ04_9ROSI